MDLILHDYPFGPFFLNFKAGPAFGADMVIGSPRAANFNPQLR